MPQASRTTVVNVTPDQFLEVVMGFEHYPEFLPEVKKITVTNKTPTGADVTYEIHVVKRIHYTLHLEREGYTVRWHLLNGELLKKNEGAWQLRPEGADQTHATYTAEVAFGGFIPVPASITAMLTETQLPALLANFKRRAEQLYPRPVS